MPSQTPAIGEETPDPDEAEIIARIAKLNLKTLDQNARPMPRGQHAKGHGCTRAAFTVRQDIPKELAKGVFQPGQRFDALVRFSNGLRYDDRDKDAHGMAIKLLDVPGPKLQPGQEDSTTQDFILIDSPVFFSDTLDNYLIVNAQ